MFLLKIFQRKWIFTTLLVLVGTALCIRLGIWQLDRLAQRRAFNTQVETERARPVLDLNQQAPESIAEMEWRHVKVTGQYDFANQVALRNQYNGDQLGYHLLTPLHFGGTTVLVDRGWIPADGNSAARDWRKYDEPGTVTVSGQIRLGQTKPIFGGVADRLPENGARLEIWNNADITQIASQMPYLILPVYIQPKPDPNDMQPPIPFQPEVDLSEGPHMGYAVQWFSFAALLFIGYPFFLKKQEAGSK
jgi:surfeit locus 1 family protein